MRNRKQPLRIVVALLGAAILASCGGPAAPPAGGQSEIPTASLATAVPTEATSAQVPTQAAPTTAAEQPAPTTGAEQPATIPTGVMVTPEGSAPTENPAAQPYSPAIGQPLNFGIVTHLYYTDRDRVLTLAQNAQFDWVRQQVVWKDIEDPVQGIFGWEELDAIVEATNRYGRRLLVNIVQSPTAYNATNGLPDDPQTLGRFVEIMAQRYGEKIQAYEIWNEPNLAHETGGTIRPEDVGRYVEILKVAYQRIKAVNPNAIVLAAASSSSGVTNPSLALSDEEFYRAMYTYNGGEVRNYFDVQAVHPGGAANPPDTLWPENPSFIEGCLPAPDRCWNDDETHYFRHIENVRSWMEANGMADKPVWITEYGWATPNSTPGYEFGNFVSSEQQAEYISAAIRRAYEQYPYVTNMFLWNINFAVLWGERGDPNHEQASFSILNPDWSPRPSYLAVQSLIAELRQKQGR
jgi:polysaccharide biosynthesis protein PslG